MSPQALGHPVGGLQRNRVADTAAEVPAIDADHAALRVDKRAAGKPRQQLGGRLDKAFSLPAPPASERARQPADDPNRHLQLTRLTDREHDLAHTDVRGPSARCRHAIQPLGSQQRKVGARITTGDRRFHGRGGPRHLDGVLLLESVVRGQDEIVRPDDAAGRPAATGIDAHHARAESPHEISDVA